MAVPQFVGVGTGVTITGTSGTVSKAGCVAGNFIILQIAVSGTGQSPSLTSVTNIANIAGTNSAMSLNPAGAMGIGSTPTGVHAIYYGRVMANGTCSAIVNITSNDLVARMYELSGVSSNTTIANIIDNTQSATGMRQAIGNSSAPALPDPAVTTTGTDRLAVAFIAVTANVTLVDMTGEGGGYNWTDPAGEYATATSTIQMQIAPMAAAGTITPPGTQTITGTPGWAADATAFVPSASAIVPSAPLGLSATAGDAQVVLGWSAPASNGGSAITAYKIYRSTTTNTETLYASPVGTGTSYTDNAAANGTTYFYKVTAVNAIGESPPSLEDSATPTAVTTAPSAPLNLVATGGNAQVGLTWAAPADDGGSAVTGYKIYRSTTSGTETLLDSPAGTGTSYSDATTANGTSYYYKVSAINAIGEGGVSGEASATPSAVATRTFKRLYGPTSLGNVASTLYTCPGATIAVIRHIHVSNPSGSAVDFTLSIGASAAATRLWDAIPVPADDVLDHYQEHTLTAGEIIQGFGSVNATLNLTVDGYEIGSVAPPAGPIFPSNTLLPSETSP